MYNTQLYGTPYMGMQGYNYGQLKPAPAMLNPVEGENEKLLRNDTAFTLAISATDKLRASCTHKKNKNFAFVPTDEGKVKCEICGAEWDPNIKNPIEVQKATDLIVDILEQIKAMYVDMPEQTATQYFMILPLIKKIPEFYKLAHGNFNSHDQVTPVNPVYAPSAFAQYNQLISGMPGYGYGYGQPMMQQQPQYGQMPYQQPMYQQPQQAPYGVAPSVPVPGENPFAYGAPIGAPMAPMVPPVQPIMPTVQAQAQPEAQVPAAPAAPATEGASKSFDV